MKILMVLTSHDKLGDTGNKTGFWAEEFAAPYYIFVDAGVEVVLASPAGGQPPIDPNSEQSDAQTDATKRLYNDEVTLNKLSETVPLNDISANDFDGIFIRAGMGRCGI